MFDQPTKHLAGAVSNVSGDVAGLQIEAFLRSLNHGLGRIHLFRDTCWRCFNIKDDGVFHIDQIVQAIAKHDLVPTAPRPRRRRIGGEHGLRLAVRVGRRILAFKGVDIFLDRAARQLFFRPFNLRSFDALEAAGVSLDHAGIHGKAFALDQSAIHALAHNAFKHLTEHVAISKTTVPVDRKGRMVGGTLSSRPRRQNHR